MHSNAALLEDFYRAFAAKDAVAMASAYAPDAHFSDPVFTDLRGPQVGAMWKMLCSRAVDLRVVASAIEADDNRGSAHWEAWYPFGKTGRNVHNVIDAAFQFSNGRISDHRDAFDFHRWAGMALGPVGKLLGWTPMLRNKVAGEARASLDKFML